MTSALSPVCRGRILAGVFRVRRPYAVLHPLFDWMQILVSLINFLPLVALVRYFFLFWPSDQRDFGLFQTRTATQKLALITVGAKSCWHFKAMVAQLHRAWDELIFFKFLINRFLFLWSYHTLWRSINFLSKELDGQRIYRIEAQNGPVLKFWTITA